MHKHPRMNPEAKRLWLEALRSGEYKQGKTALHMRNVLKGDSVYCCLGVLCAVAVKAGVRIEVETESRGRVTYNGSGYTPPHAVMEWAGLLSSNPYIEVNGKGDYLTQHNDANRFSFEDIADGIEKQL